MVQRIYTDDGNGDGRITMHGVRLFNKMIKLGNESKEVLPAKSWEIAALPAASVEAGSLAPRMRSIAPNGELDERWPT